MPHTGSLPPARIALRTARVLGGGIAAVALATLAFGLLSGRAAFLFPTEALLLALAGLAIALRPLPERRSLVTALALAVALGGAALVALHALSGDRGSAPGTPFAFLVWAAGTLCLQLAPRRAAAMHGLLIVLLWWSALALIAKLYGVDKESASFFPYLMPVPQSLMFLALGIGHVLSYPESGAWGVIASRYGGGVMLRRVLPFILVAALTVGWFRLQGQLRGYYDPVLGFAMFASTNMFFFAFFVWISARVVNRMDHKRHQAYESLRETNLELRRLNDALQAEIEGHRTTERARLEVERQLFQSQKMEAIGTLASGIAHDFNNILTVILLNAETAHESVPGDHAVQENLREIRKSGLRAADLIRQIMTFGRKTEGRKEPVRLDLVVNEAAAMLRHMLPANVRVTSILDGDAPEVLADATQLHQVLLNLGTNAAHAMAARGGELEIRAERLVVSAERARFSPELREGVYARLRVSDTGQGMDEATLKRIFDPFFTTKPPGKGTGLGLSVVDGIVRQHQGAITVYSEVGKGTVFHLYFPTAEVAATIAQGPAPQRPPAGRGQRILCVDDNPSLLAAVARALEGLGYRVAAHAEAAEALREFRARPEAFELAITDLSMPGTSGLDLARELVAARPGLPVVLMSGYLRPEDARAAHDAGVRHILLKPDLLDELGAVIHRLLAEPAERGTHAAEAPAP